MLITQINKSSSSTTSWKNFYPCQKI